jgi:hypothetical protein
MNHFSNAGLASRGEHVARALCIGGTHGLRISGEKLHVRREVIHLFTTLGGPL